jgi:hypothetical protein
MRPVLLIPPGVAEAAAALAKAQAKYDAPCHAHFTAGSGVTTAELIDARLAVMEAASLWVSRRTTAGLVKDGLPIVEEER